MIAQEGNGYSQLAIAVIDRASKDFTGKTKTRRHKEKQRIKESADRFFADKTGYTECIFTLARVKQREYFERLQGEFK